MTAELRNSLLELHRLLLDHQRRQVERISGRMSPGQLLQAATQDLRFSWINELFEPIAALDAAYSDDDGPAAEAAIERVRALVKEPDPESAFGRRYLQALQDEPDVVLVHRRVVNEL
ncbi:hypothetical protein DVA67_007980 [Solirubrobacter sp. CPCC 204708]|uniref:Uncharacterized protein n=1 Tax=Solirubrobacter deserti TaxID=2282478 RepID=A0ABT4RSN0_9ACTN|nr:hypothetical protein [Solirubrobacter deserti]MBE2315910.1 hypothetical protein [Solirubrobacter deserti]MDA0141589.1 hypothetical protein [Solirubrobacter deserti]